MAVLKKTKQRKQINDFTFNGANGLTEGELQAAALIDFAHDGESACAAASQDPQCLNRAKLWLVLLLFNGPEIRKWKEKIILVGQGRPPCCAVIQPRRRSLTWRR